MGLRVSAPGVGKAIGGALLLAVGLGGAVMLARADWRQQGDLPAAQDGTQAFLRTPNFPVSDQLPVETAPKLLDGLALEPGAVSKAALVFTPGGSTDTRAKLDAQVYYNPIYGNQTVVTGADGIEGDTASNFTRIRRYPAGSRFDLHNFTPEGLNLGTICSRDNTPEGCRPGHVYGAAIRLPTVVLPGDIVSVTMRTGDSPFFYNGPALYAGVQLTPGPGGRPYEHDRLHYPSCYGEIDINDDYMVHDVTLGHQLKMGAIPNGSYAQNAGGHCFTRAPHQVYDANGDTFAFHANRGVPYAEVRKVATYDGPHTYTVWLTGDGSNLVHYFFDGKRVSTQYYEPALSSYVDAQGRRQKIGYSLIIAAQTIPNFLNPYHDIAHGLYAHIVPNDGGPIVGGAWSATVRAIKIVHGSISARALTAATVDPNGTNGEHWGGLRDYVPK